MVWNHFSLSFCRAPRTIGFDLSEGSVHPCNTVINGAGESICILNTEQLEERAVLVILLLGGPRSVDAEFSESFNCFYWAWEQVFSDAQKCVELCLHKDYSSLYWTSSVFLPHKIRQYFLGTMVWTHEIQFNGAMVVCFLFLWIL